MEILTRLLESWRLPEDRTVEILQRHADDDFTVYPMAETRVTLRQIQEIGAQYGVRYPREFCAHVLGRFPGILFAVNESVWPRPKPLDVGPFWSFLYAFYTYTSAPESEEWMRLDVAAQSFQEQSGLKAAPILKVIGDADVYCVDATGAIVQYNHELNELTPVELDFWGLLDQEAAELKARKLLKVAES